jgi:hypothetical protein
MSHYRTYARVGHSSAEGNPGGASYHIADDRGMSPGVDAF